ncbi:hypothetical protein AB433_11330 [Croceicoccus naphthovorans]|uniref:DUF2134 domain-containing protein n=1 Tax=Croceicoccus naphthovorans TaxID=1348774 RepID=A0A0G3XM83_9SPHN|nr:hypothetical protein AB433_11330 [Croceicoccus naphthovorans]
MHDECGSVSAITLAGGSMMIGACAFAVDLGMVYLAKRDLQNAADAAAVTAVSTMDTGSAAGVAELIEKRGDEDITVESIEPGKYARLASVDLDDRFTADNVSPTAARVTLSRPVPLYFAQVFSGKETTTVMATATAARLDRAAFQVGSRLGALSGGVPNALLSALAGEDLQLTVNDFSSLEGTTIDVLDFADAVRDKADLSGETYGEVFAEEMPLNEVIEALAGATPQDSTKTLVLSLAEKMGTQTVTLADMIDLGPYAQTDFNEGTGKITVDAATLLRGAIEYASEDGYDVQTNLTIAGVSNTKLRLVGGNPVATSPLMTVTDSDDVVLRTGRIRLYLETNVAASISGIASMKVPLYAELASAEAKLSDIQCAGTTGDGVTLAVTPSIGTVALASADADDIGDLTDEPALEYATLANIVGVKVQGKAVLELGGTEAKSVHFSKAEIAAKTTKSVATDDAVTALASSLIDDVSLQVTTGGLNLTPTSLIQSQAATALLAVAPTLDSVINTATRTMGVRLGIADTRVNAMNCGLPTLVA